jgi:hypothetical protein
VNATVLIATTGNSLVRAERADGEGWVTEQLSEPRDVCCVIAHPTDASTVFAGTREQGVFRSNDKGRTWESLGLLGQTVKSIAICAAEPETIYAGTKPPALFVSRDGGRHWRELAMFRRLRRWFWFTPAEAGAPYIMGLAVSPDDPNLIIAGVEYGGMFRSTDGGQTWHGHLAHTSRDCHALKFHTSDGNWVYQAGGGWPGAVSADGAKTWSQPRHGLGWSFYAMSCAADPASPSIWYLSAAPHVVAPALNKMPRGHWEGEANAFIFRATSDGRWQRLGGGLPQPLDHMAYALVTDPHAPGHLYAGLSNGDIWFTPDHGDFWQQLPVNLTRIQYSLVCL